MCKEGERDTYKVSALVLKNSWSKTTARGLDAECRVACELPPPPFLEKPQETVDRLLLLFARRGRRVIHSCHVESVKKLGKSKFSNPLLPSDTAMKSETYRYHTKHFPPTCSSG